MSPGVSDHTRATSPTAQASIRPEIKLGPSTPEIGQRERLQRAGDLKQVTKENEQGVPRRAAVIEMMPKMDEVIHDGRQGH